MADRDRHRERDGRRARDSQTADSTYGPRAERESRRSDENVSVNDSRRTRELPRTIPRERPEESAEHTARASSQRDNPPSYETSRPRPAASRQPDSLYDVRHLSIDEEAPRPRVQGSTARENDRIRYTTYQDATNIEDSYRKRSDTTNSQPKAPNTRAGYPPPRASEYTDRDEVADRPIFPPRNTLARSEGMGPPPPPQVQNPRSSSELQGQLAAPSLANPTPVDDRVNDFPFTLLTDPTCQKFVMIDQHEPAERFDFLSKNMHLCKGPDTDRLQTALYRQSVEFQRINKGYASISCSLCGALLKLSQTQHSETIDKFFNALTVKGSAENQAFNTTFTGFRQLVVNALAPEASSTPVRPTYGPGTNNPITKGPNPSDSKVPYGPVQGMSQPNPGSRHPGQRAERAPGPIITDQVDADDDTLDGDDNATLGALTQLYGGGQKIVTSGDPGESSNPIINELDAAYDLQNGNWFKPGRIFAILWHEPAGETRSTSSKATKSRATDEIMEPRERDKLTPGLSRGKHNSIVYSSIRRMVVIRNSHGSCWCVPIGTYGGRGLRKSGLSQRDINAHTIVYDDQYKPEYLNGEPKSRKRPIAVKMARGQTLDRASRIHLGRPHSVSWNLKVMNVGTVASDDLPALIAYVKDELFR